MREVVLAKAFHLLQENGFLVSDFSGFNSCFDIAAKKADLHLLVKVLGNIDSFRLEQAKELLKAGSVLNAIPLIIGEKSKAFKLNNGLVYERHSLPVITLQTFKEVFAGEIPQVRYFKGRKIVELNSEKLQNARSDLNISLQELGEKLGVSAESIYRFEKGHTALLETARRLEKILHCDLIKKHDILESKESKGLELFSEKTFNDPALQQLHHLGLKIAIFQHAPFKAFSEPRESIAISKAGSKPEIERKALVLDKTRNIFDTHSMIIARKYSKESFKGTPVILEEELQDLKKKKELLELLKERGSN